MLIRESSLRKSIEWNDEFPTVRIVPVGEERKRFRRPTLGPDALLTRHGRASE
jgi:hypothetical protein